LWRVKIVILKTGDPVPQVEARRGPFSRWIQEGVGDAWRGAWGEVDVRGGASLDAVRGADAFVVTGSSHSVTERAPWMLRAEAFLREAIAEGRPVLGICFGHQMIAQALGGEVVPSPRGREIGTVEMKRVADDPLFEGLAPSFSANSSHVDAVATLPPGARLLAESDRDPFAAFAVGDRTRCVQFHPEFDGDVMRGYVTARAHLIRGEGLDADAILSRADDTPAGARILRNFVERFVRRT
jgi:GMP synthase (glutamine-hydrolysing)